MLEFIFPILNKQCSSRIRKLDTLLLETAKYFQVYSFLNIHINIVIRIIHEINDFKIQR